MLPPPAPISISSIVEMLIGSPLPSAKRFCAARLELVGDQRLAVLDHGELGGGAAHVEREHVARPSSALPK